MIEVYDYKYSKGKLAGYIDGKKYLNKKKKLIGYLENNEYKYKDGYTLLILKDNGKITHNDGVKHGYLKDNKIFARERYHRVMAHGVKSEKLITPDHMLYEFSKEQGAIFDEKGELALELKGNLENLEDLDFFGIAGQFLEIFS